jgi:hypothetical protein
MLFFPGKPALSPIENRMKSNLEMMCQEKKREAQMMRMALEC